MKLIFSFFNLFKFEYSPDQGFTGVLTTDVREFECRGYFDNKQDFQRYDLERKAYNTKISIEPPVSMQPAVPLEENNFSGVVVKKNQMLNLTCVAMVGCNDINYDITFNTNTTDKYTVVMNAPDRSKCLVNFNEMSRFSKSIIIENLSHNKSRFQCEISYGTDLKTPSSNLMLYFAGNNLKMNLNNLFK